MDQGYASMTPSELPAAKAYELLVASVQPRPIAFVSTISGEGELNLAPFSFFMAAGSNPLSVAYSPGLGAGGRPKDSLKFVQECGEFVINTVHREMAEGMNAASAAFPSGVSEWVASGFTPVASDLVKPPRVGESLIQMECRLFQVVPHGSGAGSANYVIGEVVRIHVRSEAWNGDEIELGKVRLLGRLGGPNYLDSRGMEIFPMDRPSS